MEIRGQMDGGGDGSLSGEGDGVDWLIRDGCCDDSWIRNDFGFLIVGVACDDGFNLILLLQISCVESWKWWWKMNKWGRRGEYRNEKGMWRGLS